MVQYCPQNEQLALQSTVNVHEFGNRCDIAYKISLIYLYSSSSPYEISIQSSDLIPSHLCRICFDIRNKVLFHLVPHSCSHFQDDLVQRSGPKNVYMFWGICTPARHRWDWTMEELIRVTHLDENLTSDWKTHLDNSDIYSPRIPFRSLPSLHTHRTKTNEVDRSITFADLDAISNLGTFSARLDSFRCFTRQPKLHFTCG